nr:DEAD/DEAH box helicase [uncultured Anaerocolumna sp.]
MKFYPHQSQALEETKDFNKVAYYLDMGLGKTYVGAEKMFRLNSSVNLLVCQKSKIVDWIEHMVLNYAMTHCWTIYNLTNKDEFQMFINAIEKVDEMRNAGLVANIVGVINYELAWRRPILKVLKDFTLILDESSQIQNEEAKQSKFILTLNPANVILLSGTPTSGKYENLWSQAHLLGWKISKKLYNKQYVNWKKIDIGGFPQWIVDKDEPYKNIERLKAKLRQYGAVFMKTEEVFDLPEKNFIKVMVNASKEYKKFMKNSIISIDTLNLSGFKDDSDFHGKDMTPRVELVGDTTLTKRLYARQLCGQYNKDKLHSFKDLASSTHDRLIIFYNFNAELDALKNIAVNLNKPISEVNGHTKNLSNYESEDNSITFIQYQAGAMGLNLQKANKIVYFTPTVRCEQWMQSLKRIHRIGQNKPCFYYQIICKGSIEEDMYKALERGVDYTDELFREYDLR